MYHKRLFRGPKTNDMKKWDGPSLSWPTPHTTPFFLPPRRPLSSPTLTQLHPTMGTRPLPRQAVAAAAGGDGAWNARTGPRPTQTCSDTPATARLRRDRFRFCFCKNN